MEINIPVPKDFNFKRTANSHGWRELLPFEFDEKSWTLARVLDLKDAPPVTVKVNEALGALRVSVAGRLSKRAAESVTRDVRHMFRLDDDMQEFYGAVADDKEFAWIVSQGAGRLLRSPTVYEDLVKSICTTNCSWALTEKMVTGLVKNLGREAKDGRKTYPTALAMAEATMDIYREVERAG